jgi:hypothetical protein
MTHATLLDAILAASPEDRDTMLVELVKRKQAEKPGLLSVDRPEGRLTAWFVPTSPPPPITQADLDELDRRIARRHTGGIDARELLSEYDRMANRTE